MRPWMSSVARQAWSGRTPILVVGVLVLLPAALLVALGVRTLAQDAQLAEAQSRERLDAAAAGAAEDVERGLALWDRAVAEAASEARDAVRRLPQPIAELLAAAPDAFLMRINSRRRMILPEGRLLYTLEPQSAEPLHRGVLPAELARGEFFEIQNQDYAKAAEAYRPLIHAKDRTERAWALQRLARTEAKAGRREEALRLYEALERETEATIGDLSADLVGGFQRCELIAASGTPGELTSAASPFYRSLVGGRWRLERPRYLYYSTRARAWLAEASGSDRQAIDGLEAIEREKARLANAVGAISTTIRSPGAPPVGHRLFTFDDRRYLAFWRFTPADPASVLIVLGETCLRERVWPAMFSVTRPVETALSLVAPDGAVVFATDGAPAAAASVAAREQTFQDGEVLWRVRATPTRPDALYAEVARRRWLYLSMLIVMVGGLLTAGLFAARTLRREVEVARLKSQFVAAVSHEFRSPLTGISQLSELLVGGKVADDRRRQQYYELIHSESRRLSRLVEQVLDFARMEDGRKEYRFERVETAGWVRAVVGEFQREPAAQGKRIAVSVLEGLPPLMVDVQAMTGAIHNLLDNAVKYSPGRDTVWLDASPTADGASVTIAIRDEGVGIPADEQRHLFERFFRGRALAGAVAGTGLGLSLVKQVVTAHGGEVSVTSKPGEGTTFTITLHGTRDRG